MDPENFVFRQIRSAPLKIAASSLLFAAVAALGRLAQAWLQVPALWGTSGAIHPLLVDGLALLAGYGLFVYGSYHAWRATQAKDTVEDPRTGANTCILDSGYYARARHPMYAMFILANVGLGFALNSAWGLGFGLLSLAVYSANGIFEERAWLLPHFGDTYRDYMRRVPARYFTYTQAAVLAAYLLLGAAGWWF